MANEIIIFKTEDEAISVDVRFEAETVWLNRQQIATLFGRDVKTIGKHINNVFSDGELDQKVVVAKFATTTPHGAIKGKTQTINVEFYNLDVIISVGYRVKSLRGTQFRIWANKVLKDYLLKGYSINNRMNRIEDNMEVLKNKVNEIDLQINTHLIPSQGVFFDGQVFDAYELASKIIRSAKESIVLIDNYIDENTLTHLAKKKKDVKALLLTKSTSKQINLDVQKANAQYGDFAIKQFAQSHDRFLIIDKGETVYHIGASLKDLGKRWFAFSKMNRDSIASIVSAVAGLM